MHPPLSTKPYVTVVKWQALATGAIALVAYAWAGGHGALSALLGGLVNISAGVVYAVIVFLGRSRTASGTMATVFRAEGGKILVIIVELWLLLTTYREVVMAAFFAAFLVTVLLFRVALFVRD